MEYADLPNHFLKMDKALYDLKASSMIWNEWPSKFLLENGFKISKIDNTLFLTSREINLLIVEVYVDDIFFEDNKDSLHKELADLMSSEF